MLDVQIDPNQENVLEYMDIINWKTFDYAWFLSYDASLIRKITRHTSDMDGLMVNRIFEVYLDHVEDRGELDKKSAEVLRGLIADATHHTKMMYKIISSLRYFYKRVGGYSDTNFNLLSTALADLVNTHPDEGKRKLYLIEIYNESVRVKNGELTRHVEKLNPEFKTKEGRESEFKKMLKLNPVERVKYKMSKESIYLVGSLFVYSFLTPLLSALLFNGMSDIPFDNNVSLKVFIIIQAAISIGLCVDSFNTRTKKRNSKEPLKPDLIINGITQSFLYVVCFILTWPI